MVRRIWPDAPIAEQADSGRWVRLELDGARTVYLQHRGWDEETRPDFIVVWHGENADQPVATRPFPDLDAAIAAVGSFSQAVVQR